VNKWKKRNLINKFASQNTINLWHQSSRFFFEEGQIKINLQHACSRFPMDETYVNNQKGMAFLIKTIGR
jgi:hypothetical protein